MLSFCCIDLIGQVLLRENTGSTDTLPSKEKVKMVKKQKKSGNSEKVVDSLMLDSKVPHSPHKATLMAMALPGLGQVYNKQYWKLPILYGGVGATIYGLTWNSGKFKDYRAAFLDMSNWMEALKENPDTPYPENPAWEKVPLIGITWKELFEKNPSSKERFLKIFENKKNNFKRNRDLCYIVMAGIYAINIIDATVFAHFYDFEIDDDLSMTILPAVSHTKATGATIGASFSIRF